MHSSSKLSETSDETCFRSTEEVAHCIQLFSACSKKILVKAEWAISSTNRRVRIYKLTVAGGKHLEREVSSFELAC